MSKFWHKKKNTTTTTTSCKHSRSTTSTTTSTKTRKLKLSIPTYYQYVYFNDIRSSQVAKVENVSKIILPFVEDRVQLKDNVKGKIIHIGPKQGCDGEWIRLLVENKNQTGVANKTSSALIWAPMSAIDSVTQSSRNYQFTVGHRICVSDKNNLYGTVRYFGPVHFDNNIWYGLELDTQHGSNNGTLKNKYYFECRDNYGIFILAKKTEFKNSIENFYKDQNQTYLNENQKKMIENNKNIKKNLEKDEIVHTNENIEENIGEKEITTKKEGKYTIEDLETIMRLDIVPKVSTLVVIKELDKNDILSKHTVGKIDKKKGHMKKYTNRRMLGWFGKKACLNSKKEDTNNIVVKEHRPLENWLTLYDGNNERIEKLRKEMTVVGNQKDSMDILHEIQKDLYNANLPLLRNIEQAEYERIFSKKLKLCCIICDFNDMSDYKWKMIEKKEEMLKDIVEFISIQNWFTENAFKECLETIHMNLFRALPYQLRPPSLMFFNDEVFEHEVSYEDPSWKHLKLVYDMTWQVVNSPSVTASVMEKAFSGSFLQNFMELFASADLRERASLAAILHKIYERCLALRPQIIELIRNYLYRIIYFPDMDHYNGVIELLRFVGAIIPGLAVPIRDVWQKFFKHILIPLHKCHGLKKFWDQLTQCCVNYIAKDEQAGAILLGSLLHYWPKQSPAKEELFIMEVVNIINLWMNYHDNFQYSSYKKILIAAADQIIKCMLSRRRPVAERAIAAWKEPSMQQLVDCDRDTFLPRLLEAFFQNRNLRTYPLWLISQKTEELYRNKDTEFWEEIQLSLEKKRFHEKIVEEVTCQALLNARLPPFPVETSNDYINTCAIESISDKTSNTNENESNHKINNSETKKRPYDSFIIFTLDEYNQMDYSELLAERKIEQKNFTCLTKTEQKICRRMKWGFVKKLAQENSLKK